MVEYLLVLTTAGRLKWLTEAIATLRAPSAASTEQHLFSILDAR